MKKNCLSPFRKLKQHNGMKLFSWLRICKRREERQLPFACIIQADTAQRQRKPPSWKEFPSPRKDERGKTSWCSLLGHVTKDLLRFHPTHSSEAETYRDGQEKGKKIWGYREQRRGGSDYSSETCSMDKQSRLCRRRKNQETSQLLRMPQRYQQEPWCTAIRARRCQLPPSLSPCRCSQLRVLCKTAAWMALPRPTPLPQARFRRAPPAVCLHAAALPPITSLHCPEGSNAHGRRCQQLGSLRPLACGPESGPVFSVTGLHNPAPQEPAPVAAYRHVPSLTLDTILHRSVYTQGEIVQPWESTPTSRVPEAAGEPAADPGPCCLSALYTHRDLSWPCSRVFVPHQSRPPPPPVLASGCWTWRCSWRPQQPLGKPCSVCWGPHSCWILVTRAEAVTAPESRAARCPCVWCPEPLEKSHGQRSLVGYSPWSHKESDMTDWLSSQTPIMCQSLILVLGLQTWDL